MKLKLVDYEGNVMWVKIGNIEDIASIKIKVVTGDEIATVLYKDYTEGRFDTGCCRMADFYDGCYEIYDFRLPRNKNLLYNEEWLISNNSYDRMRKCLN